MIPNCDSIPTRRYRAELSNRRMLCMQRKKGEKKKGKKKEVPRTLSLPAVKKQPVSENQGKSLRAVHNSSLDDITMTVDGILNSNGIIPEFSVACNTLRITAKFKDEHNIPFGFWHCLKQNK